MVYSIKSRQQKIKYNTIKSIEVGLKQNNNTMDGTKLNKQQIAKMSSMIN